MAWNTSAWCLRLCTELYKTTARRSVYWGPRAGVLLQGERGFKCVCVGGGGLSGVGCWGLWGGIRVRDRPAAWIKSQSIHFKKLSFSLLLSFPSFLLPLEFLSLILSLFLTVTHFDVHYSTLFHYLSYCPLIFLSSRLFSLIKCSLSLSNSSSLTLLLFPFLAPPLLSLSVLWQQSLCVLSTLNTQLITNDPLSDSDSVQRDITLMGSI